MYKKTLLTLILIPSLYGYASELSLESIGSVKQSIEKKLSVTVEQFTTAEASGCTKYPELQELPPSLYRNIVEITNLDRLKTYSFKMVRKQLENGPPRPLSKFQGSTPYENSEYYGRELPVLEVNNQGFVPGEEVTFLIESEDGEEKVDFNFIPYPVIAKSVNDKARIEAKLKSHSPTMYSISLKDFTRGEKIKITSISGKEKMVNDIEYQDGIVILQMPEVVNEEGGLNKIIYRRMKTGEELTITIPWGVREFKKYTSGRKGPME